MSSENLVRVNGELNQVKGALLLLAGDSAYFYSEEWLEPLKAILGKEMPFDMLVEQLRGALFAAHNPKYKLVHPESWARRIAQPVRNI